MRKPKREQIKKECFQIEQQQHRCCLFVRVQGPQAPIASSPAPQPPATHRDRDDNCPNPPLPAETRSSACRPRSEGKETRGDLPSPQPCRALFLWAAEAESSFLANPQLAVTAPNFKKKNAYVFVQIKHTHAARAEPGSLESITRQGGQQKFRWLLQARRSKRKAPAPSPSPPQSHTAAGTCARSASPPRLLASLLACRVLPRDSALCSKHLHADCSFCYKTASPSPSGREEILKTRPNATLDVC